MKRIILVLLMLVISFGYAQKNLPEPTRYVCLGENASFYPCISIIQNGIEYKLLFDKKHMDIDISKPLQVVEKHTKSPLFKTEEGISIANTYKDVKNYAPLKVNFGWGYYVELPSGWKACFFSKDEFEKPKDDEKITFFCKEFEKDREQDNI